MSPNNEKIFTISTCFYCNKTYINAYILEENKKKQQFDIDHFIAAYRVQKRTLER